MQNQNSLTPLITQIATDIVTRAIAQNAASNQFAISKIPDHHHNGTDSIQINGGDILGTLSGSGAPTSTPTYLGQMYIDTTALKVYIATALTSSSGWKIMN